MSRFITRRSLILLTGDVSALLLFVFIGQSDHNVIDPQPLLRLLSTAAFFAVPYVIAAWLLRAYQPVNTAAVLLCAANAWLVAAPLGALARSFVNGSGVILSPFLAVALGLGMLFILVWRVAFLIGSQRLRR